MRKALIIPNDNSKSSLPIPQYKLKSDIFTAPCIGCQEITKKTHPYCNNCFERLYNLKIKKSGKRGYGLFLLASCRKNTLIAVYSGQLIKKTDYDKAYDSIGSIPDYGLTIHDQSLDWVIDGRSTRSSIARYINGTSKNYANVRFAHTPISLAKTVGVSIYTKKDIYVPFGKEVELLIYYGDDFANEIEEVIPQIYTPPSSLNKHQAFAKLVTLPYYGNWCL